MDLQFWALIIVPLFLMAIAVLLPLEFRVRFLVVVIVGVVALLVMPFVDAATIRLATAKKQTGWRKILGDKTEPFSAGDVPKAALEK
jgi:hypothetical protein